MTKAVWTLVVVLSITILYHFVLRPVQMDKKLEECLYGAGVSADVDLKAYQSMCFQKYGQR